MIPSNWVLAVDGLGRVPLAGSPPKAWICALALFQLFLGHDRAQLEIAVALVRDLDAVGEFLIDLAELELVHVQARQQAGVARVLDADLAEHAGDDDLDVLVVDIHALAAVHALDFVEQVLLHRFLARDAEDVVRHQRAVDERLVRPSRRRPSEPGTVCRGGRGVRVRCRSRCGR